MIAGGGYVVGNALVSGALKDGLAGRHADTVGTDLGEDLILLDSGEFKLLETNVMGVMDTNCFGFYPFVSLFSLAFGKYLKFVNELPLFSRVLGSAIT